MKRIIVALLILLVSAGFTFGNGKSEASDQPKAVSNELTLYYSHPADWTDPIIKEFQERTGIHVNLVGAGTGELAARIKAEKDAPLADILWGGGASTYESIIDLLAPYSDAPLESVPSYMSDPQKRWIGNQGFCMVIVYNPKLVAPEDVPKGWADLLDPKFKGKIAHADPTKSSSALAALNIQLKVMGGGDQEKGWKYVEEFAKNLEGKVLSSSSATYKGVADGEYLVGITYSEAAIKYLRAGADLKVVYPEEGTIIFPGPVALVKGGPNQENAKKFIDYIQSMDVQKKYPDINIYPARTDVPMPDYMLPGDDPIFKPFTKDLLENTAEKQKRWKDILVRL